MMTATIEVCTPAEIATIRADAARMTWDQRHNAAMLACAYAETVVRERHRAATDPNPAERALSREYAAHAEAKVREAARVLMIEGGC